jgi:hypothetical protein
MNCPLPAASNPLLEIVLAEVVWEESKARLEKRAWEKKKLGDVRLLPLLLCSLFLCWHVIPSCLGVA